MLHFGPAHMTVDASVLIKIYIFILLISFWFYLRIKMCGSFEVNSRSLSSFLQE